MWLYRLPCRKVIHELIKPMIKTQSEFRAARRRIAQLQDKISKAGTTSDETTNKNAATEVELVELEEDVLWYQQAVQGFELPTCRSLAYIGRLLIAVRLARGISQAELAGLLGVSKPQISQDETGGYAKVSAERAGRILEALGAKIALNVSLNDSSRLYHHWFAR